MKKIRFFIFIVFVSLFLPIVSIPYYCAAASSNEGETEVIAHIDPVDSEQTDTPDGSGSALMQKDENTSEKTGKPVQTGDILFRKLLLFGITMILAFIVILLLRLRHTLALHAKHI